MSLFTLLYGCKALVGGNILLQKTLPVLYTSLRMVTSDMLQEKMFNERVNLVAVTLRDLKQDVVHSNLPDEHIIAGSTKCQPLYNPLVFMRATIQSMESYEEQQAGLRIAGDKMNKYLGASGMMEFLYHWRTQHQQNCNDENDFIKSHISWIEWYVNNPHVRMSLPARWDPLVQATSVASLPKGTVQCLAELAFNI
jgi:hypothetical protein